MIGYHASHEQFSPRDLLNFVRQAEGSGFGAVMSSDHITPWSVRQGNSGYNWAWLGAALEATNLRYGSLAIPTGHRHHPAIIAQAAATLSSMYPGRFTWIAAGSGEAMNEHITGDEWPNKDERNQRLLEGVELLRSLWAGETVTRTDGLIKSDRVKIWSLPEKPPQIYGAALSLKTARWIGEWADGMITVHGSDDQLQKMIEAFHEGGGKGKKLILQLQISWAATKERARHQAWDQWRCRKIPAIKLAELRTPEDFDAACAHVTPEEVEEGMLLSHEAGIFIDAIQKYQKMGFQEIYLHNAGRNQSEFIEFFGKNVLSQCQKFNRNQAA